MVALLVRIDDYQNRTSTEHAFTRSPLRIGRNPLNDLTLTGGFVSQWHAIVQFNDTGAQYFDLGSTNGTLANGQRVQKNVPVPIHDNTEFRIGPLRLYFARGPVPPHLAHKVGQRSSLSDVRAQSFEHTMIADGLGMPVSPAGGAESTMIFNPEGGEATTTFNPAQFAAQRPASAAPTQQAASAGAAIAQMRMAVGRLRPLYVAYRQAWNALYQGISELFRSGNPEAATLALTFLEQEFPEVASEEQFRKLAQSHQLQLRSGASLGAAALQLITQFAQYVAPEHRPPQSPSDIEAILVRTAAVLDAFTQAYVGLRKGQDQFGSQMAVSQYRDPSDMSPLNTARDAKEVLAYLMDWGSGGQSRTQELTSAYADIMIHQVALLNGLMEGVRSLLQRLGPAEIEREVDNTPIKLGPLKLPRALWPFRAGARWARYVQRHREFTEEDREITAAVFGAEFAKAYAGVVGESYADGGPARLPDGNPVGRR